MKNFFCYGSVPLIAFIFAILFTNAAGPYWLAFNNDPAYFYFFNFLYLLDKLPLYPTTHPGLTLDVLGALTIKLFHPLLSHQDLFLTVIKDPEFYLHVVHGIMVVMYVVSLGVLGWYAYKKSKDIYFSLLVQLGSLLVLAVPSSGVDTVLPVMAHVKPETLLVTATNLLMIGLLKLYWSKDTRSKMFLALYLGLACAVGVFTKYTFILSLFLVFFLLRGFPSRCWFILSFIVFGYIFSFVETDPYHRILIWVKDLIFKSGFTGAMSDKFIEPADYMPALMTLISQNLFVFLTAGVGLMGSVIKKDKFLFFTSGCVLIQFLMVAKHPNPHYMIFVVGLCGLNLAVLYDKFRDRLSPQFLGAFIALFIAVNGAGLIHYVQKLSEKNTAMVRYSQNINAAHPGYVICPFYQASSPVFVLACYTNDMHNYYNQLLKKLYPDYYYYDTNARDFKDFLSRWVPLSEIKSGHQGVLLYGNDLPENVFRPYTVVRKIDHTPQGEALYEVVSQQSPHAQEFFQYSLILYAQGQWSQALQYALYAKELGLPEDIEGYLNHIVAQLKSRPDS